MNSVRGRSVAFATGLMIALVAQAQGASDRSAGIPAQPLATALASFAKQNDLQLIYLSDVAADQKSSGAPAGLSTTQALDKLLEGTGLSYELLNDRMVRVYAPTRVRTASNPSTYSIAPQRDSMAGGALMAQNNASPPPTASPPPSTAGGADITSAYQLQDVIVTASRRAERIIDVPYAITSVGGVEIQERGAISIKDMQYSIPGLQINETNAPGTDRVQLRGVDAGSGTGLPTVGIYVDEVGISIDQQQRDSTFPLVDIERVEVLRGPQGTLYGQGSVSGTIRYLTKDPSLNHFDGFVDATVYQQKDGDTGYRGHVAVSVPIVDDTFGMRLVGGYDKRAGWVDYPAAGKKDANEIDTSFVRAKFLWRVSDKMKASLLYQYLDQKADASNASDAGTNRLSSEPILDPSVDKNHLLNLVLNYDFGPATLTASTGYLKRNLAFTGSGSNIGFPGGFGVTFDTDFKQFTQELRIASNGSGPLRYVAGLWYRDFISDGHRDSLPAGVPFLAFLKLDGTDPVNSSAYAAFGDATWAFSPKLEASVGLRYYKDHRKTDTTDFLGTQTVARLDAHAVSPRFNVLYKWTDKISTYATASKGFRSGGFNFDNSTFKPENLWSYEIGTKAALADGHLYIDAAAYELKYKDRQSNNVVGPFAVTTNGGEASGPGFELAASARLPYDFTVDMALAYNDIKYDKTTFESDKGERFNYVPPLTASVSVSQRFPLGSRGLRGFWRADYQYADGFFVIARFQAPPNGDRAVFFQTNTQSQSLANLRFGIEAERYAVTVAAENLFNEDTLVFPNVFIQDAGVRVRPRSYSLNLRYSW